MRNNGPEPVWRIEIRAPKRYTNEDIYYGISDPQLMYEMLYSSFDTSVVDCPDPDGSGSGAEWTLTKTIY